MWGPPPGLGFSRTRRQHDADLFVQEHQHNATRGGRRPGLRERRIVTAAFVTVIIAAVVAQIIWG